MGFFALVSAASLTPLLRFEGLSLAYAATTLAYTLAHCALLDAPPHTRSRRLAHRAAHRPPRAVPCFSLLRRGFSFSLVSSNAPRTFLGTRDKGPTKKRLNRSAAVFVALHLAPALLTPPDKFPDLFPALTALACAVAFGLAWLGAAAELALDPRQADPNPPRDHIRARKSQ